MTDGERDAWAADKEEAARVAVSEPSKSWSEMTAREREDYDDFCDSMSGWNEAGGSRPRNGFKPFAALSRIWAWVRR